MSLRLDINFYTSIKIFLVCISFFNLDLLQAEVPLTVPNKPPAKVLDSNARIFLNNTDIPKQLEEAFDRAVKHFDSRINSPLSKDLPIQKREKLLKLANDFKNSKNSFISAKLMEIEKRIEVSFTEAELKYLAKNSGAPLIKKLNYFMRSEDLEMKIASPFAESSKLFNSVRK